jgi:hypothetical protein
MKKVLLIAFVAGLAMASCKKDYTCNCTVDGNAMPAGKITAKKKDAQASCDQIQATYKIGDPAATCTLK